MSAARELFAREGTKVQMDVIAAHAGVGVGTLYRHFPTREAILTELVIDRFQGFSNLARTAENITDPFEAIEAVLRSSSEAVEGDRGFQLAMMGTSELDWDGIAVEKAAFFEIVTQIIGRAVDAGVVREDLSFVDIAMLMCGIASTMYFRPAGSADWRRHLDLVVRGIGPVEV